MGITQVRRSQGMCGLQGAYPADHMQPNSTCPKGSMYPYSIYLDPKVPI